MVRPEYIYFKGTKDTSFWLIDVEDKLAMPIVKYFAHFCPKEGPEFTVTKESDEVFTVITKKNRVIGVCFENNDAEGKTYIPFEGKMVLALQLENSYCHYKIMFADFQAEEKCHSVMFESCGYDKRDLDIPFKSLTQSLKMFTGISGGVSVTEIEEKQQLYSDTDMIVETQR